MSKGKQTKKNPQKTLYNISEFTDSIKPIREASCLTSSTCKVRIATDSSRKYFETSMTQQIMFEINVIIATSKARIKSDNTYKIFQRISGT